MRGHWIPSVGYASICETPQTHLFLWLHYWCQKVWLLCPCPGPLRSTRLLCLDRLSPQSEFAHKGLISRTGPSLTAPVLREKEDRGLLQKDATAAAAAETQDCPAPSPESGSYTPQVSATALEQVQNKHLYKSIPFVPRSLSVGVRTK